MSIKQILGYICLAGGVVSFVFMYLTPRLKWAKKGGKAEEMATDLKKLIKTEGDERLIRIEERTALMIPLQLILIGSVLLT